jgi:hypothetical protein
MTILYNLACEEHGLRNELKIVIEDLLPHGTPAIRSRGIKILRNLENMQ